MSAPRIDTGPTEYEAKICTTIAHRDYQMGNSNANQDTAPDSFASFRCERWGGNGINWFHLTSQS
jgi:hypothetical protein